MVSLKDERLAALSAEYNVAQFVSLSAGADPRTRFSRVRGRPHDERHSDIGMAIEHLFTQCDGQVNVRSFRPDSEKGNPFYYGITKVPDVVDVVTTLAACGYTTIVNETVDTNDGGVSGVALNGLVEFVPGDTPRGVEKPGAASLPYDLGLRILSTVYGFQPQLPETRGRRIEFSLHPLRVGYRREHTLVWESERVADDPVTPTLVWPNRFSRLIGDKAYGLLLAACVGLPVPTTTVITRTTPPFQLGRPTGTGEIWTRPCPQEQEPGLYPTSRGWGDPYELLKLGHPDGTAISSVLAQEGVDAAYSGATLPGASDQDDWVEGVEGYGDGFMQGERQPARLPDDIVRGVRVLASQARKVLGPVRLEFAHDGKQAWVLQLHRSTDRYHGSVISPGVPVNGWLDFDPGAGLADLRKLIERAASERRGIRVTEPIGVTSHVGDLLRRARVPALIEPPAE